MARAAVVSGVDAVGFVFSESPRQITPARAAAICKEEIPPWVQRFAVFRRPTPEEVERTLAEFTPHFVQTEVPDGKSIPLPPAVSLVPVFHDGPDLSERLAQHLGKSNQSDSMIHLENPGRGGQGIRVDWNRASVAACHCRLVLAGGLNPQNVQEAVLQVRPFGVDVSSGVESSPGVKDPERIAAFIRAAHAGAQELEKLRRKETDA